jgi:hypothetical protein
MGTMRKTIIWGWAGIATYIGRHVNTVRRMARRDPRLAAAIHQEPGDNRRQVYAFEEDIDQALNRMPTLKRKLKAS